MASESIAQPGALDQVVEERVVPRLHVLERLPERDMQDVATAHEIVQADLHQARGLAHPGTRHDDAQVALP